MALRSVLPCKLETNMSLHFYASAKQQRPKLKSVPGPRGPLFLCDLPSADHKRWTVRNKLEVVAAVSGGLLSLTEACSRYRMSVEEFRTWEKARCPIEAPNAPRIPSPPFLTRGWCLNSARFLVNCRPSASLDFSRPAICCCSNHRFCLGK